MCLESIDVYFFSESHLRSEHRKSWSVPRFKTPFSSTPLLDVHEAQREVAQVSKLTITHALYLTHQVCPLSPTSSSFFSFS